jgi:acetolactate synthase I/II/III large subunit
MPAAAPLHSQAGDLCAGGGGGGGGVGVGVALLHLGPGLANAIANLHNARRARSRVLAIVGDMVRVEERHKSQMWRSHLSSH